ncbi:hypothetical protein [Rhodococcus tukisamuensis]|uniref:hypothetical protein n=1 Tax=Rhodococcus tukisamuensis TaxID=168276 RepID=UPI001113FD2D|nr:hypothetical protein [Rhodococcus tukisamuensis]
MGERETQPEVDTVPMSDQSGRFPSWLPAAASLPRCTPSLSAVTAAEFGSSVAAKRMKGDAGEVICW